MRAKYTLIFWAGILFYSCATSSQWVMDEFPVEIIASYTPDGITLVPESTKQKDEILSPPLSKSELALHYDLWKRAVEIIPDEYERYIKRFEIYSDGPEGMDGYVEPHEKEGKMDPSSWTLAMDIVNMIDHMGTFKNEDLDKTVIHEFAHVLSLNSSQADSVDISGGEDLSWREEWNFSLRYRTHDAVFREEAYLNRFFLEFWGDEMIQEWFSIDSEDEEEYWSAFTMLGIRYHTHFVSDYAMTDPVEDFAESFLYFVLEDKPEENLVSHRKVRFFYDYPELVQIRDDIRQVLSEGLEF